MTNTRTFYAILACFALLAAIPTGLRSQSIVTGAISGTVIDPTGLAVQNAAVTVANVDTGATEAPTYTNTSGNFLIPLLKPGSYVVTVNATGFHAAASKVEVRVGSTSTVNLSLEIGAMSQTVEVIGGAQQRVQSEDANISTNINLNTIQNVPNPGGDLTYYAQLSPGVTMSTASGKGYGNFSVYGLPATSNLFTIDGDDYNDSFLNQDNTGSSNLLLGSNDISDVDVVVNGYTGQYGRQAGAQVDYTTKSGSNAFHGDAIYNWNGTALNANDYFQNAQGSPRPFMNNNQWAAAFGGPIKKNKAFFYVDTEGIRYVFGTSSEVFLPTADFESYTLGNLSSTDVPFYQKTFALYNGAAGAAKAAPVDDSCGYLEEIPTAGSDGEDTTSDCLKSFYTSGSNGNREWMLISRADFDISDKDKLFLRAKIDRGVQPTYTDPIDPSAFNILSAQPQYDGQLNYTHIFGPNIVNNFIGSVLYYSAFFNAANESTSLSAMPDLLYSFDTSLFPLGIGSNAYGYEVADAPYPNGRNVTQWQLVDDISIQHGNHTFKFGANFRRDDISDYTASEGSYPAIGSYLYDFASGIADYASMEFAKNGGQPLAFSSLGFYAQDEFRVNSRLKMTLAVRLEPGSAGTCQDSCVARMAQPFQDSAHDATGDTLPLDQLVVTNIKQILPPVEKIVAEPRIGVAWSPFDQNTVIRGGIGLFADLYPGELLDFFTRNSPEVNSFSVYNVSISPAEPDNAQAVLTACNNAYNHAFNSGGTFDDYQNTNITLGSTTESAGDAGCGTPLLYDAASPLQTPKYLEWNFEIQHAFGRNTTLSVDYVGNHGWDEYVVNPYLNSYDPGNFDGLPSSAPDTRAVDVLQVTNGGISNYDGLTVSMEQRLWHGLQASVYYTYGHSLDDVSNGLFEAWSFSSSMYYQIDPYNLQKFNYGSSDYDDRHSLVAHYEWALPFRSESRGLNAIIGGWSVSGTFFARSGFPFSIVDGNTSTALYYDGTNLDYNTVLGQPITSVPASCTTINPNAPCYSPSQFAGQGSNPAPTAFATVPRNSYRGPAYFNTDLSLYKTFQVSEGVRFALGMNAYNILNHVNFANPGSNLADTNTLGYSNATVTSPTTPYGSSPMAATDMRIIQLTTKLEF